MKEKNIILTYFFLMVLPIFVSAAPVIDGKFDPNEGYDSGQVMVSVLQGSSQTVVGKLYKYVDPDTGDISVAYVQSKEINDNSYGANAVNWGGTTHTLDKLLKSDKATFRFTNADGDVVLDIVLDYFSGPPDEPTYDSLGAAGGDGAVNIGSVSWVVGVETSLDYNFNVLGYVLTTNSPEADSNYNLIGSGLNYPGWIFDMVYEMKISGAAFGTSGFGAVTVPEVHNSPPKFGDKKIAPEPGPSEIRGTMFEDKDGDGIFDSNEVSFNATSIPVKLTGKEIVHLKLQPVQDTYIKKDKPNKNSGTDKKLRTRSKSNKESRTLIQFDLSNIPSDAVLTSANLNIYLKDCKDCEHSQADTVKAYRITREWTETGATWNKSDSTRSWTTAGGDFDATVVGSFTADGEKVWKTINIKTVVDQWLNGTPNNGVLLIQEPSNSDDSEKKYTSKDEPKKTSERPFLEIIYTRDITTMTVHTDTHGNYSFKNLNPGTYTLTAGGSPTYTSTNPVSNLGLEGGITETIDFGVGSGGSGGGLYVDLESFSAAKTDNQVDLIWSTASEIDSAGFNILRGNTPYGQFSIINTNLISARGNSFTGADYSFTDYEVANATTYYYELEEVETSGNIHIYGPVRIVSEGVSLLSPVDGGSILLDDPRFEVSAAPDVERMVLYISSSPSLKKGRGTIRLKIKRGESRVKFSKRARRRLAKLASKNGWTLYAGVFGSIKGKRNVELLSNVNSFNILLSARVD